MPLAACQTSTNLGSFVPGDRPAGTPVSLPQACRGLLQPVAKKQFTATSDARAAYTRRDAEVDEVNARIIAGGECVDDENRIYLGSKTPPTKKGGAHGAR